MWQVLLAAAAAAGSGVLAKRLFNPNAADPSSISERTTCPSLDQQPQNPPPHFDSAASSLPHVLNESDPHTGDPKLSTFCSDGSIFRFSSSSGSPVAIKPPLCSRKKKEKGYRKVRGQGPNLVVGSKKSLDFGDGERSAVGQRKVGKRFGLCLKKRRKISRNKSIKCESCCGKDNSFFEWGLGIMYMMSAGKAEIDRVNMTIAETAKVVQELKSEVSRRKSLCNLDVLGSPKNSNSNRKKNYGHFIPPMRINSSNKSGNSSVISVLPANGKGECASSIFTEGPQPELLDMDQLEAELESELEKLPWGTTEASVYEGGSSDVCEIEISAKDFPERDYHNSSSCQSSGVLPSELDQKLCHLLIEQQENQIVELESELQQTNSKLSEKEAELQALKDCVRRLSEFSLTNTSDAETEAKTEGEMANDGDLEMGPEAKESMVGRKRAMDYEHCYTD